MVSLLVACFHLPAVHGPGCERLLQADHRAAAVVAAAADALVAEAADPERRASFLVGRAVPLRLVHQPTARLADELRPEDRRDVALVQLHREVPGCRTAWVRYDPAAEFVLPHPARD